MTDLNQLGEELRTELGEPPASFGDRQRLRLRGLDLSPPKSNRRPMVMMAAVALCSLAVGGIYFWPSGSGSPSASHPQPAERGDRVSPSHTDGSISESDSEIWLGADSKITTHRLADGSSLSLQAGGRGRLDQRADLGTRFDLHEGTASFHVRKQKGQPFSVVAGEYRVIVIGTRFTTSYVPPRDLSVTVDEGAVQVQLPGRSAPVTVDAGETLQVEGREFALRKKNGNEISESAGKEANRKEKGAVDALGVASWQQLYHEGKYKEACEDARAPSLITLRAQLGATELMDLGSALRLCGDSQGAMSTLQSLRQRYPSSPQAHDALFLIGRIHATLGQSAAAISHLEKYLAASGGGRFAAEALGRLIELHEAGGNQAKARDFATRYLQMAPQGPYRRLAESVAKTPE